MNTKHTLRSAVILHGTSDSPRKHWFKWLEDSLQHRGVEIWVPALPEAERPDAARYTSFLLESGWDFDNSLVIGHSSGADEILHLLAALPDQVRVSCAVLVSPFLQPTPDEEDYEQLLGLFARPFEFVSAKAKCDQFIVVHGADDPWCSANDALEISMKLGGEFVLLPTGGHFVTSLDSRFTEFPELLEILEERVFA